MPAQGRDPAEACQPLKSRGIVVGGGHVLSLILAQQRKRVDLRYLQFRRGVATRWPSFERASQKEIRPGFQVEHPLHSR